MILMAALSGNAEMPACHRRWVPCTPCYPVYYYPCVYYVYPCVVTDESSGSSASSGGGEGGGEALSPDEEKEYLELLKDTPADEKAVMLKSSAKDKRAFLKKMQDLKKDLEKKGKDDKGDKGDEDSGDEQGARPAPATIRVHLPADATLTIDGEATASTSSTRWFVSPPLPRGEGFSYELKAKVRRDGRVVTLTKRVPVQAGQETEVRFDDVPAVSVARN
jgi:uncharacterized protein (TIGR03000 family)